MHQTSNYGLYYVSISLKGWWWFKKKKKTVLFPPVDLILCFLVREMNFSMRKNK